MINWFSQFVNHCRCYSHLLFSNHLYTDKLNIVHFVLNFIRQVHFLIFIWAFIQIFFHFRHLQTPHLLHLLQGFPQLSQWSLLSHHLLPLLCVSPSVSDTEISCVLFIAFQFTFFWRLFTSCFWYLMSIVTCISNRFRQMPVHCHLSHSTFQYCSNHLLGWF